MACEGDHLAMSQQPGGIMQQLLLLCCPCQTRAQLVHHLCRKKISISMSCLDHGVKMCQWSADIASYT